MMPMDSGEMPCSKPTKNGFNYLFIGFILTLVLPILTLFFLSIFFGIVAIFFWELPVSSPIFVPAQCKIVFSSVDIRSSKVCVCVCELGVLNYKAKRVFYLFEGSTFRCRYDYYWASVFKVEYIDHSLGQTRLAFAEAPNEALPLNCRPNFGAAWLTKDKFKVSLYRDGFFSCQAKDPSTVEMIKRYFIPSKKILQSWFASKSKSKYWRWGTIAGVSTGFLTSLITISLARILQHMKLWMLGWVFNTTRFKCACFLVVYLSVMGWLAIQYRKRLVLLKIFHSL